MDVKQIENHKAVFENLLEKLRLQKITLDKCLRELERHKRCGLPPKILEEYHHRAKKINR